MENIAMLSWLRWGAVGVIVATHPMVTSVLVAWTNGRKDWMKPRWVKPYEGYAGKNDKDIK